MIDPQYRKTVGFIYAPGLRHTKEPVGTAFFIGLAPESDPMGDPVVYAVTAKHVLDGRGDELALRVRTKDGGFVDLSAPPKRWTLHSKSDLAILRLPLNDADHDTFWIPREQLVTRRRVTLNEWTQRGRPIIGEGDEVFYPGLYHLYAGTETLLPVMRSGHIALMPYEPIPIEWTVGKQKRRLSVDAYLIECKSWHGFSGSPAFLYYPVEERIWQMRKGPPDWTRTPLLRADLLGMVSSYWDYALDTQRRYRANAGLAVVIHADDVDALLDEEGLVTERKKIAKERTDKRPGATGASVPVPKSVVSNDDLEKPSSP
jgi:hypothetical protein